MGGIGMDPFTSLRREMVEVGGRVYVKATAGIYTQYELDVVSNMEVTAFAREALEKKGMDAAQITGAASSYARKYALNGLFAIDDTKDADHMDNTKPTVITDPATNEQIEEIKALLKETGGNVNLDKISRPAAQVRIGNIKGEIKKRNKNLAKELDDVAAKQS